MTESEAIEDLRGEDSPSMTVTDAAAHTLIRVAIVDEVPEDVVSTAAIVDTEPDLAVIGTGLSGAEALHIARDLRPEVLVLDLSLPDADGESITRSIVQGTEVAPAVLAMTDEVNETRALSAFSAGASGVCAKDDPSEVVVQSIRTVRSGEPSVSPSLLKAFIRRLLPTRPANLRACTSREVEVLRLVAEGATNSEIGGRLFISPATVRSHIQSLRLKLGVRDRVSLVVRAYESGLVSPTLPPTGLDRRAHRPLWDVTR